MASSRVTRARQIASYVGAGIIPAQGGGVTPPNPNPPTLYTPSNVVIGFPAEPTRPTLMAA